MIKYFTLKIVLICSLNLTTLYAQSGGDILFSEIKIHTVKLNFTQPNYWDSLLAYYYQAEEKYMQATVTLNGILMDSIGVRLKGNSSFSHPNNKKSLRLSFDEYVDEQVWDGLKGVHLNNCYGDPTFMREKVHLDFCRSAGITAPRANYANVFINDSLFGFYSLVEHVNKGFLTTRFGSSNGDLFKAVDAFEGVQAASDFRWFTSVPDSYYARYDLKNSSSTTAWTQLINFLDTLNNNSNTSQLLPMQLNLTAYYKAIGADILFANLDSYQNSGRNFYFYFNPSSSKLEWIVWDVGLSFGCYGGGVSNFENLSVTYLLSSSYRPLSGKIFSNSALKQEYLLNLCYLFNSHFTQEKLFAKIDSLTSMIRPHVYADPRKQYSNSQFETNIFADLNIGGVAGTNRIPGLKSFISSRRTSVQTQLNNLGINCASNIHAGEVVINEFMAWNDALPDPNGEFEDWIELYNLSNESKDLSGLFLSDSKINPAKWQFPLNTSIAPNGYLIVWADEDEGQQGLHANFKLSSNAEEIIFSKNNLDVLDSLSYGEQLLNLSMSRFPNGTGNFVQGFPTFNAFNNPTDIGNDEANMPKENLLFQNYPNPFNPTTVISYQLSALSNVTLKIYDILGNEAAVLIDNEMQESGRYDYQFTMNGANNNSAKPIHFSSGIYFYKLTAGEYISTKKMIILK